MGQRFDVDWTRSQVDADMLDILLSHLATEMSGLTMFAHADGRMLLFTNDAGIRHAVSCLDDNNWACFCGNAVDGECIATTLARLRYLEYRDVDNKR